LSQPRASDAAMIITAKGGSVVDDYASHQLLPSRTVKRTAESSAAITKLDFSEEVDCAATNFKMEGVKMQLGFKASKQQDKTAK